MSGNRVLERILSAHALDYVGPLAVGSNATVHQITDASGRPQVLKCYGAKPAVQQREQAFYESAARQSYEHLLVPRLLKVGDGYAITEFVEREVLTRRTVVERIWTAADVDLWVRALLEFQATPMPRHHFSIKKQVLGLAYPVVRTGELLGRVGSGLSLADRGSAYAMMARYSALRPFIRNVLVHYDLQTSNYTFAVGTRKMSMLDFEFSYYEGDPLFDVVYYCTIPVMDLADWDVQRRLLARYVALSQSEGIALAGWQHRTRLILLLCLLTRYLHFAGDADRQQPYWKSIERVLSEQRYRSFIEEVRAMSCSQGDPSVVERSGQPTLEVQS